MRSEAWRADDRPQGVARHRTGRDLAYRFILSAAQGTQDPHGASCMQSSGLVLQAPAGERRMRGAVRERPLAHSRRYIAFHALVREAGMAALNSRRRHSAGPRLTSPSVQSCMSEATTTLTQAAGATPEEGMRTPTRPQQNSHSQMATHIPNTQQIA